MAKGIPAGRLNIEIVAEIARLQTDLDKAKRAVAAASKDIANNARAANDNLRGIGAGAGAGIQQFSRDVAALKGQLDPSFAALQKYKQEVALLQKALGEGAITHKQFVEQMRGAVASYNRAGTEIVRTTGAGRNFTLQMSQVAQQVSAGTGVLQALAIQLPDIAAGMSAAGGAAKGFAGFLAGPWGLAITAGLAILVPFVAKLWETGDAASDAGGKVRAFASSAVTLGKAAEETSDLYKRLGELQKQYDNMAGPSDQAKAFFANTVAGRNLAKAIADLKKEIDLNRKAVDASINIQAAEKASLDAVKDADKAAAAAKREHSREARDSAKAAREAAKAQEDYSKSLLGLIEAGKLLGQMSTELDKGIKVKIDWAGPTDLRAQMGEIESETEGRQRIKEAEDYMDQRARDRFIKAANDFADIIGGKLGRTISALADVFDRYIPELTTKLGESMKGIGGALGDIWKNAGIGGGVAGATGGSGLGGMAGGALGGWAGKELLGGMLGKLGGLAGPIGAIAGGILGGVVGGLFKKVKKASATIEIMAGEAMQTSLSGNSAKLKKVAGAMADGLIGGLTSIADQLGGMLGDGIKVSIGQRDKTFRVDLQGLGRTKNMPKFDTEEEAIAFAIQEVIKQGAITGLRAGTEALIKGQGDLQAQLQKAISFENVFKELADRANPAKASIDAITKEFEQLIDIFDEAGATAADYAQLQELMAIKQREVIEQAFEPIRTMLDDLKSKADDAGEAVKTAFQGVLDRETAAIEAYQAALEAQQQAAREKTIDALQDSLSKLQDEAKGFADAADRLRQFSATVFGTPGIATLRANFAQVAAQAQGGDVAAMNKLPDVGAALRDAVTSNATDRVSMVRELNRIRIETDKAAGVADARVSAAERQAAAIEKQLTALTAIEETAVSIDSLLAEMQTAKAAADLAREQMAKLGELTDTETSFADAVAAYEKAKAERDDLIRQITVAGFADLITVQQKTGDQLISALQEVAITAQIARTQAADAIAKAQAAAAAAAATRAANDNLPWMNWLNGIPGFASGGTHSGGLRIVGEDGPELEYTGPSRIMNADQIASAVMGSASADEIGQAVAYHLHSDLYQIAKPLNKIDARQRGWDGNGMPPERDVA